MDDLGYLKGDLCNREGCIGIIDEFEKDGCCTCHTGHPPCSYCTTDASYCPVCGWNAIDEQDYYDRVNRYRESINKLLKIDSEEIKSLI